MSSQTAPKAALACVLFWAVCLALPGPVQAFHGWFDDGLAFLQGGKNAEAVDAFTRAVEFAKMSGGLLHIVTAYKPKPTSEVDVPEMPLVMMNCSPAIMAFLPRTTWWLRCRERMKREREREQGRWSRLRE